MMRLLPTLLVLLFAATAVRAQAPSLTIDPNPIRFGCTLAGEDSAMTIHVWNTGSAPVTILEYIATAPFVAPSTTNTTLDPGNYRPEVVRFQPIGPPGNPTGTLTIRTPDGDVLVDLVGEVGVEPSIMPSMTAIDFFDVALGESKEICFKVRNPSCRPLPVTTIGIDNPLFTITRGPTAPFVLGPFAEIDYCVTFTPTRTADESGLLTFEGDLGKRAVVRLAGRGVRAELAAIPDLVNFGTIDVGSTSAEAVVRIVNRGTTVATIESPLAVTGPNAGDFLLAPVSIPLVVSPGDSVPLRLRFRPGATGPRVAQLVVTNTSDADPVIELRGVGSTFDVSVTPGEIDMGDVFVGSARIANDTIIVTNRSTRTVTIASTTIQGADPSVFSVQGFVTVPIAAGTDYRLDIRFAPTAPRVFTAELVGTLDNGATFIVLLRGRGLDTAAVRPRRIIGDTVAARVGERALMHFTIEPPLDSLAMVTRLVVRVRMDPKAIYPHRATAAGTVTTRSYDASGVAEITMTSATPLAIDGFDLEVEGLFTGRPRNVVTIDSLWNDNPRIGMTATPSLLLLEGCDVERGDTLLRVARIDAVAPNPTNGRVTLTYLSTDPALVRIVAIDGRVLLETPVAATGDVDGRVELDLGAARDGSFVIELRAGEKHDLRILQINR